MIKLYAYVDESGQDTEGRLYLVGVLITGSERDKLEKQLLLIERESGRGTVKWRQSSHLSRKKYFSGFAALDGLQNTLFVAVYNFSKEYLSLTAKAISGAVKCREGNSVIVYVDALREVEQRRLKKYLKKSVAIPTQVRGIRREENNAFIRLVDSVCGLARDAAENHAWAKAQVFVLKRKKILRFL